MKLISKALCAALVLSTFSFAENLDGTLAVDALAKYNNTTPAQDEMIKRGRHTLNSAQDSIDTHLSAGLNDDGKDITSADTIPATTSSYASSAPFLEGPFIGFEISPFTSVDADDFGGDKMSYGLRFGAQNTEWRTMAVLEKMAENSNGNDYLRGLLQLDYYFFGMDNLMLDTYAVRPYVGLNAGVASVDTNTQNIKTLTYGAEAGATMNLTNQLDLDVSYRYNLHSSEYVDSIGTATVGLHYKY